MHGSIIHRGIVFGSPEILHDVDFAAGGPTDRPDVLAEHPERRPDALTKWNLDAGDDHPVLPIAVGGMRRGSRTSALQTRGGVVAGTVANRANDQIAVAILEGILRRIGIGFGLAVSPSAAAQIVIPLGGIGRTSGRSVEFVAPYELPTAGGLG